MPAAMSQKSLAEYIQRVRNRYERMKGKLARSRLLDEFCAVSGLERKYALKVLRGRRRSGRGPGRGGAPRRYEGKVVEVLRHCWCQMEQPCGKRMKGMLPLWVGHLEERDLDVRQQVLAVSAATIDRLLVSVKVGGERSRWCPGATRRSRRWSRSGRSAGRRGRWAGRRLIRWPTVAETWAATSSGR